MPSEPVSPSGDAERLSFVRAELRFELGLLHDRVNALVAAETFITIAYTTAMSNATPWGTTFAAAVSPVLSVLGLLLALLSWPGVTATVRLIRGWTSAQGELLFRQEDVTAAMSVLMDRDVNVDQDRSLLFFRAVPALFAVVWAALTVVALVLPR